MIGKLTDVTFSLLVLFAGLRTLRFMRVKILVELLVSSMLATTAVPGETSARPNSSYNARGVLQSFDPITCQATIAHEEIRGYMPAMTMSFEVANVAEIRELRPGDTISFVLRIAGDRAWIERIHKENTIEVSPADGALTNATTELPAGSLLPDIELLDESGTTIHVRDFRGKVLAISFIYLRCPLPTYCPLINRNFETAQNLLSRLGEKDKSRLLSISMDPENDTPERLAAFAKNYREDRDSWTFATGQENALHQLGRAVGLEFQRKNGQINHNLRTVVIDPTGHIRRIFRGNTWTPQELVAEIRSAATGRR